MTISTTSLPEKFQAVRFGQAAGYDEGGWVSVYRTWFGYGKRYIKISQRPILMSQDDAKFAYDAMRRSDPGLSVKLCELAIVGRS